MTYIGTRENPNPMERQICIVLFMCYATFPVCMNVIQCYSYQIHIMICHDTLWGTNVSFINIQLIYFHSTAQYCKLLSTYIYNTYVPTPLTKNLSLYKSFWLHHRPQTVTSYHSGHLSFRGFCVLYIRASYRPNHCFRIFLKCCFGLFKTPGVLVW